jgi:DnaJ-domain-containing protein 1
MLASLPPDHHTCPVKHVREHIRPAGPAAHDVAGRRCDAPGCAGTGEFRAPRSRDRLTDYYWFCLEHVREYNRQWNFYAGMSEAEVERQIRADTTWQRPTWPLGVRSAHRPAQDPGIAWGAFSADGWDAERIRARRDSRGSRPRPGSAEEQALATLDLEAPITREAVKVRYKLLVKKHHPDANGGSKDAEERFKLINQAYSTLMASALMA